MEKVKKFLALLGVVGLMALLPLGSVAASAAEPETVVSWRFYESEILKEEVTDIAVSPDGESINFVTEDGEEYVVDRLTDEQFERVSEDIKNLNLDSSDDKSESEGNSESEEKEPVNLDSSNDKSEADDTPVSEGEEREKLISTLERSMPALCVIGAFLFTLAGVCYAIREGFDISSPAPVFFSIAVTFVISTICFVK